MATPGNFARVLVSGYEVTGDSQQIGYSHIYTDNKSMAQNVGVEGHAPGAFDPTFNYNGYARRGNGAITAHNLLFPTGLGGTNDTEYLISAVLGNNAAPTVGDVGVLFDGKLLNYQRQNPIAGLMTFQGAFKSYGKRMPPFPVMLYDNSAIKTATNFSTTPYDDGAETASGTTLGGVAVLQVYNPTGTAATGSISLSGIPSDGDSFTLVIGGVTYTYTFKTSPSAAGHVLIGASASTAILNLYYAMVGSQIGLSAGAYFAGTVSIPQFLISALVFVSTPTVANVINLRAAVTGTAANAYSLSKSGVNLVVSAATMSGGVAGDTYNVTWASATTSGGAYTTYATMNGVGATWQAIRTEIAVGTAINEWHKLTFTLASGAGTSQVFAAMAMFGRWFQS